MNISFYRILEACRSYQQDHSSSPPQYNRVLAKVWLTLSFLGILLMTPVQAQTGAALSFDGSNDHVTFPSSGMSASAGTMEFWVNTISNGGTQMYIDLWQEQFTIFSTGTTLRARIAGTDLSASFTPGQWNHLALTWGGNGTTARLYLNGVQVASGTQGATTIGSTTGYLSRSQTLGSYFVSCTMDEVRLWNVQRSATDIANNYCSEISASTSGLQNYYKFNQGTASGNNTSVTTLTDATANGRTGTLVNFTLTGSSSNWVAGNTWSGIVAPSVSIAGSPSGSIVYGTSVTFTATPTNGGTTPSYQWKKNGTNVGTNSATYTDAALNNGDIITCVLTSNAPCISSTTATSNSVTMTVTYPAGAGLAFDGTDDWVTVPHNAAFNITGGITIEAWIKTTKATENYIITKGDDSFYFGINGGGGGSGKLSAFFAGVSSGWLYSTTTVNDGNWHHVAAVRNGTTVQLYIDGVLNTTGTVTSGNISTGTAPVYIGVRTGQSSFFLGSMDEVRVWNRALSGCEIQNNKNCELGSGQTGLAAYYKFNQGFGFTSNTGVSTLTDASGNNLTGTLNNFALTGTASNWVSTGGVTTGTTCTAYVAPSVSIAGSPSGSIVLGTSVTFTATPTNGGATPAYQWKKNGTNVGTNSTTYTDATLANGDVITCVLTNACNATATSNSITMTVTYPPGAALHFDGTDDYVAISNTLPNVSSTFTLEAWVNPDAGYGTFNDAAEPQEIISRWGLGGANNAAYRLGINPSGQAMCAVYNGSSSSTVTSTATIATNTWTHIAATRAADNTLSIYINGVLSASVSNAVTPQSSTYQVYLGKPVAGNNKYKGKIDEVRIWNRALPLCEIQNNRNCELGSGQTGLLAYYQFNQGFGSTSNAGVTSLTDASGNSLTGTLTNFGLTGTTSNWVSTGGVTTGTTCTALPTPSVSIAGSPSGTIAYGTSVTFTATPTNGGTTPTYQWKKNGTNVGTSSTTYTDATLANGDVITCVMTSTLCTYPATATSNSVTMTVTYPAGAALHFDGTNDYVEVPTSTSINSFVTTGELTIEYWLKLNAITGQPSIIDMRTSANNSGFTVENYPAGSNTFYHIIPTTTSRAEVFCNYTVNEWQHIAITAKAGDSLRVYRNGVLQGKASLIGQSFVSTNGVLRMMARAFSLSNYTNGTLDEVRLWNRSLPLCEIQNNMNCELGSGQTGLIAYYKFNQGSGFTTNSGVTSLTDASGNNNTGTLTNLGLTGATSNWVSTGGVTTGTTCTAYTTPSVSIAGSPSGSIAYGTSVTFTATPTNGGITPTYQWKKNGTNVGTNSATYTDAALANGDVITCVLTNACNATATSNSVTMTVTYPAGAALHFDGTNDYVEVPHSASLNDYVNTGEATIEYWIKPVFPASGNADIIAKRSGNNGFVFEMGTNGGTRHYFRTTNNTWAYIDATYTNNVWQHVAVTVKTNSTISVYINGVLASTTSMSGFPAFVASTSALRLMANSETLGSYTSGAIDEVRIWNRALPLCEIQNNMNCELGSGQTGLMAYYKFNQGSGFTSNTGVTSLTDASGNSNTGTLTNFGLTGTTSNWVSTGGVTTGTTCTALPTPSVSIAGSPSGSIVYGTSVTFTATPTNGGTPTYQWKKNGTNVGTNSTTYTDATLVNGDVITCVMTSTLCVHPTTATSNSLTMTVTYPAGAALHFDGTNDYVDVNVNLNQSSQTLEAWIYPQSSARMYAISNDKANSWGAGIGVNNNLLEIDVHNQFINLSSPAIPSNQWTHVAVVYNSDGRIKAYVNGAEVYNNIVNGWLTSMDGTSNFWIGRSNTELQLPFQGRIDEVRVWNRSLPQCEIQNNMNCELGSGQTGLVAYYKFNQGSGFTTNIGVTSLTDASGNNNTGTLTNFGLTGTSSNWVSTGGVTTGTTCTALPTPSVSIAITTGSQTTCAGTSVTFTATPTNGGTTPTYQWKKNGTDISGATSATYTSTTLANNDAITCVMTSNATCPSTPTATSNSVTMTVNPTVTPSVSIAATATTITEGASVTFTATPTNGGTTPQYQWKKNGTNISGATNATYTSTTLANGDVITCALTSNAACATSTTATSNSLTMTVNAPLGAALHFDGVNDYVEIPHSTSLNTFASTGEITVEFWVKPITVGSEKRMLIGKRSNSHADGFAIETTADGITNHWFCTTKGWKTAYFSYIDDTWQHIAVTAKSGDAIRVYQNGVLTASTTLAGANLIGTTANMRFMLDPIYTTPVHGGALDEVRVWSRVLPQCEIQNNMNCELGGGQTALQAYYKFNQGVANTNNAAVATLTDASGNNNNGTLLNFALTGTTSNWVAQGGVTSGTTCSPAPILTPSVSIAASATTITFGTSVTFTATPTNGGATPYYQWKRNGVNVGTNSVTYTNASLLNGDVITCVMTSNETCISPSTATSNGLTMTVTGVPAASALNFDGVNDYVSAPAGVYFNGDLTIEAWVYPKSHTYYSRIIDFGNGPNADNIILSTSEAINGKPVFALSGQGQIVSSKALTLNQWNHVAVTLNGTLGTLYVNGVVVGTRTYSTAPANVLRNNCYIGKSNWSQDAPLNGSLDEVRIWNRALLQCEIQKNMNCELGSGQTGLLAYYKFNQGALNSDNSGTVTLNDASGNNRHATLSNFALTGTTSNWTSSNISTGTTCAPYTIPSVSIAASSATICLTNLANLTSTATGLSIKPAYQWEISTDNKTFQPLSGAQSPSYSVRLGSVGTTYFRLKVTDVCGIIYSASTPVIVINPTLNVTANATQACQNETATLTATTTSGSPTYQWQSSPNRGTWTNVAGATSATYTPPTSALGTTYYRVVATYNSGCILTSAVQTLTVSVSPTASVTGGNVTVGQGSTASNLTAVINSTFASVFQWQSSADGSTAWTDIADATTLVYTPSTATVGTLYYRLKVTFAATVSVCNATIYSNSRRVTVEAAPTVTIGSSSGASQRLLAGETLACVGTNLTLTSSCSDATATPSWTGPNGFTASTANITLSNITPAMAGKYRVIYLTATGYIGEQTTTINVRPELAVTKTVSKPSITSGSSSQIALTGKYKNGVVSKIKFATSSTLRFVASRSTTIGSIPVCETTDDNSINQDWLFIPVAGGTVNFNTSIGQKYYIQSVYSGLYLSASATNPAVVEMGLLTNSTNFEWTYTLNRNKAKVLQNGNQRELNNLTAQLAAQNTTPSSVILSIGSTPPTMTLAWNDGPTAATRTVSPTATTNYIATFTNSAGCSIKDTTTITVVPSTTVSVTPSGNIAPPDAGNQQRLLATNVCRYQPITLSATVSNNSGSATYQWEVSTNGTNWSELKGALSSAYNVPTNQLGTKFYRVIVTNSLGIFTSEATEVFVIDVPTISIAATQATVCPNATPTLTVGYTAGFGTPTIQWQSSPDSTAWTNISGATAETYQPVTTTAGKTYYRYIATFTGACPTFTSKGVAITVKPTLTVSVTGVATQTVCQGSYRFFTLSSNDATATYAWQSSTNGTTWATVANATSASYVAPTNTVGTTYYRGIVSAAGCSATSDTRQITTSTIPTVTVASPYAETCVDRPVSFTATLSSTSAGTPTFVWQTSSDNLNWVTKATGSTYNPSAAAVGSTYVRAGVKFAACADSTFSVPRTLLSNANPIVTVSANSTAPCSNVAPVLTANLIGGSSSPTYQWQKTASLLKPQWTNISGATNSVYTAPTGLTSSYYRVQVKYNTNCPEVLSQAVQITPKAAPSVAIAASGTAICQGSTVDFTSTITNGVANQTFQWQSSPDGTTWTDITGATTASYSYTAATVGSTQYRLEVSASGCNDAVSSATTIAVTSNAAPTLAIAANNLTVCGDAEVVVTATPANLNGIIPQYEWRRNGELFTGQPSSFATKSTTDGLGSNVINDIAVVGKNVYLATDNGLAVSTDGGMTFTNKTTANGLPSNKVLALGLYPDGSRIIVGTDKGAKIASNQGSSFAELSAPLKSRTPFNTTGPISNIGVSPNGNIAYMTAQNTVWQLKGVNRGVEETSGQVTANSIVFKNNTSAYLLTAGGITVANGTPTPTFSKSPITSLPFKRAAFRGDTIFAVNTTNGLNYYINNVQYSVTGLPAASTIQDVVVNDNVVYVTATSGLYMSKDGGKSFLDITSSVGLGTNPGLGRIVRSGSFIYVASSNGLRIASATSPTLTFTTNKSDVIECVMTTAGVCTNTVSQALTVNYIGEVDPLSIKVTSDGTTSTGTWTAVNNATGYGWELMKYSPDRSTKTFVKNGTVTTNSVTLADLNPSTNYELTVKTLCTISTAFARLADVTGAGAGSSTSFTTGFVVPHAIRDSLLKISTLCAEDELVLGPGLPDDYQVNIYSGTDKSFIDYASSAHPFRVRLTANTKYFYKVVKFNVKTYTFTPSNNDAGSESKRYTVPAGVSQITFKAAGSKGGGVLGGNGGVTIGNVTPTAGAVYYLFPGTTTTADAGLSRGTSKSANGGGGSYISTTSLRKDAIIVAGGGGGGHDSQDGGIGGLIGGNGFTTYNTGTGAIVSAVTGGTATTGGISLPANNNATGALLTLINQRSASGFMKGSSTNNVTSTVRKGDYGGGGGYYGGGSFIDVQVGKYAGGGGGSSYVNTAIVNNVLYQSGVNSGTGYVTINEYYQGTSNSDFLPLDIVVMPVPVLSNPSISLSSYAPAPGQNMTATFLLTGNAGFSTSYYWIPVTGATGTTTSIITFLSQNGTIFSFSAKRVYGYANVQYCLNRTKQVAAIAEYAYSSSALPPNDSSSNRGGRLLTPSVSIVSSATNICGGEQVIFTATPTNVVDENLSYTWYKNGEIVFGQTNNVLQTNNLANGDVITCTLFYPSATGPNDSIASTNTVVMTVATPATPKVTIAASANDVCPGTAITFTPTPTAGGTTPQYRWYLNGDYVQTSDTYTSANFENSDYVECIMESDATCISQTESEISPSVSVTLKPTVTPTATVFVSDTLICSGGPTSLTVRGENIGSTPQYQWRHNGAPVGTDATYYPASVSHNDAIWCEITPSVDACANTSYVVSNTELIQTADADASFTPLVTIEMSKDSICTGESLIFTALGNYLGSNASYVWKKNGVTLTEFDADVNSITLQGLVQGDVITCEATSSLTCTTTPTATSNALTAKVVSPATPTVSITTDNTTICPNIPVVISATPNYGGTFPVYSWRLNGTAHNALPHEFFNYTIAEGLGDSYTQAVFVRNDTAYAATAGGLSYRVKGDSIYTLSYKDGLFNSNVQAIYADDSGVYAGTDEGLSISTDGLASFRPINKGRSGLSSANITAITAIGSTLFVGTDDGLNISTDGGTSFTTKKSTDGLASNKIRHLFADGTTLYIGTEGGLNISTDNGTTFSTKTIADSLNSDTVLGVWAKGAAIYAATQQGLAVSTDGGTTFAKLTMSNGLPDNQVNGVWVVADSMVYAATSGGLGISKNGGKTFRGFYETDTLGSNVVLGVTVANGRIYAATTGGWSISDPSKIRVYPNDGDVFATNLMSNKSCTATSTAISNNLTFHVGTVSASSLATTLVMNTSATLTWTGTTSSYNWIVVPTGEGINGTVVASGSTSTLPIAVTGLTSATTYDLFVQGACTPEGTVDWVGPLTFTTKDDAFVSVKTILQGAYSTTTGLMGDNLRSLNLIPTTEPYSGISGFTHVNGGGGEKVTSTVLAVTGNDAIVDWVFVELRDKTTPATVIATRSALIQRDGDVVDVDGVSPVGFPVVADDYYVVVRHRNHLGIRTASTISLNKVSATPYDFTTSASQALSGVQKDLTGGKFGMYGGNVNSNNTVRASGPSSINDYLRLINLLGTSSNIQSNVYSVGDVNMDGTMRASGPSSINDYLKIINAIGSSAAIITQPF
ncbi:MAG: hypothetical protein JNL70_01415 [Saprospiraceae bacterium]|nr:hypothetical protein [Saprospiraceae bacterium]